MTGPETAAVLQGQAALLGDALRDWEARGTVTGAGPNAAAHMAIALMDAMLAGLHQARSQLITENRAYNDRLDTAVDELLSRLRAERSG